MKRSALIVISFLLCGPLVAYELVGSIVDLDGKPVKNADVVVSWQQFDHRYFSESPQRTRSNEEGVFQLKLKQQSRHASGKHKADLAIIAYNGDVYAETFVDPRYDRRNEVYDVRLVAVRRKDRAVRLVREDGTAIASEKLLFVPLATAGGVSTRQYLVRHGKTDESGVLRYEYMDCEHSLSVYAHQDNAWSGSSDKLQRWAWRGRVRDPGTDAADVIMYNVGGTYDQVIPDGYDGRVFTFQSPMNDIVQTVAAFDERGNLVFQDRIGDRSGRHGRVISWQDNNDGPAPASRNFEAEREKRDLRYTKVGLPGAATHVLLARESKHQTSRSSWLTTTDGYDWIELPANGSRIVEVEFKELTSLPAARVCLAGTEEVPKRGKYRVSFKVLFNGASIDLYWHESDDDGWFRIPIFPSVQSVTVQTWGGTASSDFGSADTPRVTSVAAGKEYTLKYHRTVSANIRVVDANGKPLRGFWISAFTLAEDAAVYPTPVVNSGTDLCTRDLRAGSEQELCYLNQRVRFVVPEEDGEVVVQIAKPGSEAK